MEIVSEKLLNVLSFGNKKALAVALWPIIIFKNTKVQNDPVVNNHEKIHHRQQLELLLIPYYIWYFLEYWIGMFRYKFRHQQAYSNVSFEREAFKFERDFNYLKSRRFLASYKFLFNLEKV
ncbi:MAG: hypothetical protein R2852_01205 [Bacteroidia bacterium]